MIWSNDEDYESFPCKDCITLPICRLKGTYTGGVSHLAFKCSVIDAWLSKDRERDWDGERMLDAYGYFQRGWKDDHAM